jgi:hypothetical protein
MQHSPSPIICTVSSQALGRAHINLEFISNLYAAYGHL